MVFHKTKDLLDCNDYRGGASLAAHAGRLFIKTRRIPPSLLLLTRGSPPRGTVWISFGAINGRYVVRRAPAAITQTIEKNRIVLVESGYGSRKYSLTALPFGF